MFYKWKTFVFDLLQGGGSLQCIMYCIYYNLQALQIIFNTKSADQASSMYLYFLLIFFFTKFTLSSDIKKFTSSFDNWTEDLWFWRV